jgi:hypothetical protein
MRSRVPQPSSLFDISASGRLTYAPFLRFELPLLFFELPREQRGDSAWADFRLSWPGTLRDDTTEAAARLTQWQSGGSAVHRAIIDAGKLPR